MTTDATPATEQAAPELVHAGRYALFTTPSGGRHLVYQPDELGEDVHVPDIPAEALPLVQNFLENGLPPAILAMLGGKMSPLKMLGHLKEAMNSGA